MKLTADAGPFADAVGWVAGMLPRRPAHPVLTSILAEAEGDSVALSVFDYETSARVVLPTRVAEPGRALLPGRRIADVAKTLPDRPVELAVAETTIRLDCGAAGFNLSSASVDDYPRLPDLPPAVGTVDAAALAQAVGLVAYAASRNNSDDDGTTSLAGIWLEAKDGALTLTASDRYQFAVVAVDWPGESFSAVVPAGVLQAAAKTMTGEVVISLAMTEGGGVIGFASGHRQITTRLLNVEKYPTVRIRQFFAKEPVTTVDLDTADLLDATRRMLAAGASQVRIEFDEAQAVLMARFGDPAEEPVPAALDGPPITVQYLGAYLVNALSTLGEQRVRLGFTAANLGMTLRGLDEAGQIVPRKEFMIAPCRVT